MQAIKSDIDLLATLMRDDEVAFTEIYKRYQPSLFEVCMKYQKNEDTPNDVVVSVANGAVTVMGMFKKCLQS